MKSSFLKLILGTGIVLSLLWSEASAAKVKVWHHTDLSHHENSAFEQSVISNQGVIRLSRQLKELADLKTQHIWDMVEDKSGNLFVATGNEGKLYKVNPAGKVDLVYTSTDNQILSLAAGPDGSIYAGTGPSGTLVHISPNGKAKVVVDNLDSYVWSLVIDPETKTVYAGTGPQGRIYQVTSEGKATVFYTTKQQHILCLAYSPDNMLYAGTDKNGMVYRIDPRGKGFVLYSAPQSEVHSLVVTAKGIYAGTSAPSGSPKSQAVVSDSGSYSPLKKGELIPVSKKEVPGEKAVNVPKTSGSSSASEEEESDSPKGKATSPNSPPGLGENSLYRISPDGTVSEMFREKAMILAVLKQKSNMLVGTGMKGQLFEVNEETKERTEIARLENGQIHCLLQRRDGSVVVGTGDPGRLYVLAKDYVPQGTVTSEVLDAKLISKWGTALWRAKTPSGSSVTLAFRSGNIATPDETWSDWSEECSSASEAKIGCPTARFLQYRITMKTANPLKTPAVESVTMRYLTTNHAPEVGTIEVKNLDSFDLEKPEKIKIKWRATDPNEDELTYSLFVRKEGWKSWISIKEDLGKREFQWDASTMPSGMYQVKVVASDNRDNTDQDTLTSERVSSSFVVANEAPKVTLKVVAVENGKAVIEATATDPMIRISHASYAINGKNWKNAFPQDGLFDGKTETFRFTTQALNPGSYVIMMQVRNAAGITGTTDAVFTVPTKAK